MLNVVDMVTAAAAVIVILLFCYISFVSSGLFLCIFCSFSDVGYYLVVALLSLGCS